MKKILLALITLLVSLPILTLAKAADLPSQAQTAKVNAQERLSEAKLKVCQNRENAIKKRSEQLTKMGQNMLDTFDKIAGRGEKYYTEKVIPSGKTVSNYDALLADIAAKKTAVQTALTKAQAEARAFSCTSDNPKGQLIQFREDMQAVKKALKDYRTSIKNLIVAIRSLVGQGKSSKNQ